MLLDDVFGELDTVRSRALMRLLPAGTQKLVTTTSLDWALAEGWEGDAYQVESGALTPKRA